MIKDKIDEFKARVIKEWKGIPEGAGLYIQYESKTRYYRQWPNGPSTIFVGIPKTHVKQRTK